MDHEVNSSTADAVEEDAISERLRLPWESDEHWKLRRSFLEKNWGSMPNNRLVCLSNCFANMEILGCSYNKEVTDEVNALAALQQKASYHAKRKKVVEVTFARGMEGNVGNYIDTSDRAAPERDDDRAADIFDVSTRRTVIIDEHGRKTVEQEPQPTASDDEDDDLMDDDGHDPIKAKKLKRLIAFKAFMQTANTTPGTFEHLNYACYKVGKSLGKALTWKSEFEIMGPDKRNECWISVDGVLITRTCFLGEDTQAAKLYACKKVAQIFDRRDSDVRKGRFVRGNLAFVSSPDKRKGWKMPDEFLYAIYEDKFKLIRTELRNKDALCKVDSYNVLFNAARAVGLEPRMELKRLEGWQQDVTVFLGHVLVHKVQLSRQDSSMEARFRQKVCCEIVNFLTKEHLCFYDDPESGTVSLMSSDEPITMETAESVGLVTVQPETNARPTTSAARKFIPPRKRTAAAGDDEIVVLPSTAPKTATPARAPIPPVPALGAQNPFFIQAQKLQLVRDTLAKIDEKRSAADRLHIACIRSADARSTAPFQYRDGRVTIFGVSIAKATGPDAKAAKEAACRLGIEAIINPAGVVQQAADGLLAWVIPASANNGAAAAAGVHENGTETSVNGASAVDVAVANRVGSAVVGQEEDDDVIIEEPPSKQPKLSATPVAAAAIAPPATAAARPAAVSPAFSHPDFTLQEIQLKTFRVHLSSLTIGNVMQRIDMAAANAEVTYEVHYNEVPEKEKDTDKIVTSFACRFVIMGVVAGRGKAATKPAAKQKACQDVTSRLLQTYFRIIPGPDGPEVISSNTPIMTEKTAKAILARFLVLGTK